MPGASGYGLDWRDPERTMHDTGEGDLVKGIQRAASNPRTGRFGRVLRILRTVCRATL